MKSTSIARLISFVTIIVVVLFYAYTQNKVLASKPGSLTHTAKVYTIKLPPETDWARYLKGCWRAKVNGGDLVWKIKPRGGGEIVGEVRGGKSGESSDGATAWNLKDVNASSFKLTHVIERYQLTYSIIDEDSFSLDFAKPDKEGFIRDTWERLDSCPNWQWKI